MMSGGNSGGTPESTSNTEVSKYDSIKEIRTPYGRKICRTYSDSPVVVTEKIHGANFSIYGGINNKPVFCKRSGPIADEEDFYGFWSIRDRLSGYVMKLLTLLIKTGLLTSETDRFQVFGELFGGLYPGMKAPLKHIQKGVYYTPHLEFMAFDLQVNGKYLPFSTMFDLVTKAGYRTVPVINRSISLKEAIKIDISQINSRVPEVLGFDPLESNIIEGVVIRVNDDESGNRYLIKYKNEQFAERSPRKKMPEIIGMEKESLQVLETLTTYICENRYDTLVSKYGSFTSSDILKATGLLVKDILTDFSRDGQSLPNWPTDKKKTKKQDKLIKMRLFEQAKNLVTTKLE